MSKPFAYVIFLLGILVAQVICPNPPENGKNSEQKENSDEETENDSSLPLLTCVLFENDNACKAMCSIISSMYDYPTASGTCQGNDDCQCTVAKNTSIDDYWKAKFDSEMPQNIRQDKDLPKKILNILEVPYKTPQQTAQDLKPMLSASQVEQLRPRNAPIQKLIVKDGKFDKPAIQKYVDEKIKSSRLSLPSDKGYKKNLEDALGFAKDDIFDQIIREVRNTQNKRLNDTLDKYLEEYKMETRPVKSDDPERLVEILDSALVNQVIKPSSGKKRSKRRRIHQ